MHGAVQIAGLVDGVGVGEEQPPAARFAGCGPDGVVLAGPALFELAACSTVTPGKLARDLARSGRWSGRRPRSVPNRAPAGKTSSDCATSDWRQAPRQSSSLRAGTITVSSMSGSGSGWSKSVPRCTERRAVRRRVAETRVPASMLRPAAGRSGVLRLVPIQDSDVPSAQYYRDVRISPSSSCSIVVALAAVAAGCDRGAHPSQAGKPAPDFTVSDGANSIHLANYRGKWSCSISGRAGAHPAFRNSLRCSAFITTIRDLAIVRSASMRIPMHIPHSFNRHVDLITVRDPNRPRRTSFTPTCGLRPT